MNDLLEKLDRLNGAVRVAPDFARSVMDRLPEVAAAPMVPKYRKWIGRPWIIGATAASVLIVGLLVVMLAVSPSPQEAFGQMVQRVAQYDSVTYDLHYDNDGHVTVDHRTVSSDGRRRSDLSGSMHDVITHNPKASPDLDLYVSSTDRLAKFELVDQVREAYFATHYPQNPVVWLQQIAAADVVPAPDEIYQGKPVRVYVSKPGATGGARTTRVFADKETGMPLRIETEDHKIFDNFQWNPAIYASTYSVVPPKGYAVVYDLIRPLSHGLDNYAANFHERLPDQIDLAALEKLRQVVESLPDVPKDRVEMTIADATWGFRVPAFAAAHGIDFHYYGAGQSFSQKKPGKVVVAVEIAPGAGEYDCLLSNFWRERIKRSELP